MEDRRQVRADHLVVVKVDALEDTLVEVAPGLAVGCQVVLLSLAEQAEDAVELPLQVLLAGLRVRELPLRTGLGERDALLLGLEDIERNRVGVVSLQQLVALGLEGGQPPLGAVAHAGLLRQDSLDVLPHDTAGLLALLVRQGDRHPVVLDELLDQIDLDRAEGAAVLQVLPAETVEVAVQVPEPVPRVLQAERLAALTAVDRPLQVVRPHLRLLAALVPGLPHGLHPLVEILGDQGFVSARVLRTLEGNDADVVAVLQDAVDLGNGQRPGRLLGTRNGAHALALQFVAQGLRGPLAGGIALVQPAHPRRALLIRHDGSNFAAFLVADAGVQVAERHHARRTAIDGFLSHTFTRLGRQVATVELGDRAHDAVQQHPAWRLVDVLGTGDKGRAGRGQGGVNLDVVHPVAGQPVDLVHDDVPHPVVAHVAQQPLQVRPISRAGTLPRVDELLDDRCAE